MPEHPAAVLPPEMHDAAVDDTLLPIVELTSDEEVDANRKLNTAQLGTTSNKRRRTRLTHGINDRNTPLNDWMEGWAKMGKAIRAQEKALAQARNDQARLEAELETQRQNHQQTIDQRDELQLAHDELSIQRDELQEENRQVKRICNERIEACGRSLEKLISASRCGICYSVKPDLFFFPCGHVTCAGCRGRLLTSGLPDSPSRSQILRLLEETRCPHCREPVGIEGQRLRDLPVGKYLQCLFEVIGEIDSQMAQGRLPAHVTNQAT